MIEWLASAVAASLDGDVRSIGRVGGGDVAESFKVEFADGRTVFAKTHRDPPAHFFQTEADGLTWMRATGAVAIPEVLAVDDGLLVLEWIDEGGPSASTDSDLGRSLAELHRAGAPSFGREDRRTTGSRRLPNEPSDTWAEFYSANRLVPLAKLWRDARLPPTTAARLETVAGRLPEFGAKDEPPARLHGDLWAGNRLVDRHGRSWLIDPAAHGGHREFDLAMMRLFGGYGADCFDAYDEVFPLTDGWQERVPLHQLAPLAVHAIKFGGGYVGATARALDLCI